MSLRFSYRQEAAPQPVPSLRYSRIRPRPLVIVTVLASGFAEPIRALLDTGADDTMLPDTLADDIGIDLTGAPTRLFSGIGSSGHVVRYAPVRLRLTDSVEYRDWPAVVGFSSLPLTHGILGFAGALQFFDAMFFGQRQEVELTVNASYPGV